jgi:pteridine reductase
MVKRNPPGGERQGEAPLALVTGGAVRVGRAICLALARDGFRVAIHHNTSTDAAAELVAELERLDAEGTPIASDLTRPAAPAKLVGEVLDQHGQIDLLVNNAALFHDDGASMTELARMKVLNYDVPAALLQAVEPHLERSGGSVINIADVAGVEEFSKFKAYSRTKSALLELTQRKALELAAAGVRVNAVCPGMVLFPESYTDEQRRAVIAGIPLGRAGTADDVARAVVFLARAEFVTGQAIAVDGGRMLKVLRKRASASPGDAKLN